MDNCLYLSMEGLDYSPSQAITVWPRPGDPGMAGALGVKANLLEITMKVQIERSKNYVAALRVATGENVPDTITVDIAPAAFGEEMRTAIIALNESYPENLGISIRNDGTIRVGNPNCSEFRLRADITIDGATPELVESLFLDQLDKAKKQAEERKAEIKNCKEADERRRDEQIKRAEDFAKKKAAEDMQAKWKAERRQAQIEAWLNRHGTPSQQGRYARGLLDESEILDAMRDQALQAVDVCQFPKYARITQAEVVAAYIEAGFYVNEDDELVVNVSENPALTDAEFATLQGIEAALPGAQSTVRKHVGMLENTSNEEDEVAAVTRKSVLMTVVDGELKFSREYAL